MSICLKVTSVFESPTKGSRFNFSSLLYVLFITLLSHPVFADISGQIPDSVIKFPKNKESVYSLLSRISEKTGLLFIYDSELIDNNKIIKLKPGKYYFDEALKIVLADENISLKIDGRHALLYKKKEERRVLKKEVNENEIINDTLVAQPDSVKYFSIGGILNDRITGEPVVFASISIKESSASTISNLNGHFKLVLPDSLVNSTVKISHLGYETTEVPVSILAGQNIVYALDQKIVPLQEVVVRVVDPLKTIKEMLNKREINYAHDPVMLTIFYREGVEFANNLNLSEAVLQIYKTGYRNTVESEQVKLLKMRKISNPGVNDTILAKVKSSIYAFQQLDVVKNLPDFLDPEFINLYNFHHSDITSIDDRRVYVITFEQKPEVYDALYRGEIFIDADNLALLRAKFELNPEFIRKAADVFVVKKDKSLDVSPSSVKYDVDYKLYNGTYFINHIRGDINFKIRKKWKIFSSLLHVWFEMVNCNIDTGLTSIPSPQSISGIKPIPASERISPRNIFSETVFTYDPEFWGNFNVILPESQLIDLINKKIK